MTKSYILSVDDEALNQEIVLDLLEDDFEIDQVNNGQACLDHIAKKIPDLILLDVNMSGLNGLEICKKIRANEQTQNIPVIFLSALASLKERMQGYDAGGDDYITKPFDEDELITKIKLFIAQAEKKKAIDEQRKSATDMAMISMTSNSEAGFIVQFMQRIFATNTDKELVEVIFSTFSNLGLEGCVMLKHKKPTTYVFSDGIVRSIEKEILAEAFRISAEKIMTFSGRAILKTEHAAVLIRRMPADEEKAGRYRDHLAVFLDGLEAKLKQCILMDEKEKHYIELEQGVEEISASLVRVNESLQHQHSLNTTLMGKLALDIEESFLHLGLEEKQEDELIKFVIKAEKESDEIFKTGQKTEQIFTQIIDKLNSFLLEKK